MVAGLPFFKERVAFRPFRPLISDVCQMKMAYIPWTMETVKNGGAEMATSTVVNGLDVQGIQDMVEMVRAQPQVAKAAFYATTIWESGFHNEAVVKPFSMGGVRNDTSREKAFTIVGDHPQELLGTDKGPSSVEVLLSALGHCLASGWAIYGANMGISIDGLRVEVEGDIDL